MMNANKISNYLDTVLTPYYKQHKYPSPSQVQKMSLDTKIAPNTINDWYLKQRRIEWETKDPVRIKIVRLKNVESKLLKCFNKSPYFDAKVIAFLIIETELQFDDN